MCSLQDSLEEQASRGSFVAHGRQDVLTAAIRQPEHPGHVRSARASVMIKKYFGPTPRTSHTSSSMAPEDLEQLTQKIRDQLEESITEKVTRQLMLSFNQMQSQFQSQMQSQGPSAAHVSTKESYVDPSENNPNTSDSDKYGLYVKENPPCLVIQEDFIRDPQPFTTFLCYMIKSRLVLRRLEMQMLPFLYPLKRLSQQGMHLTPSLLG